MSDISRTLLSCDDGFTVYYEYTHVVGAPWFTIRDYAARDGGGSFIAFQTPDRAGNQTQAWLINPGLVDATPGKVSSDIDFIGYSRGAAFNFSITGAWTNQGTAIAPAVAVWPSEFMNLGTPYNKWLGLYLKEYAARPGMPTGTKACVQINGRFAPLFD